MIEIEPIHKQVVLQEIEEESDHSFIVPEQLKKRQLAKVVAAGPNVEQVKEGDNVTFRRQLAQEVEFDGKKFLVADEGSLLFIVKAKKNG